MTQNLTNLTSRLELLIILAIILMPRGLPGYISLVSLFISFLILNIKNLHFKVNIGIYIFILVFLISLLRSLSKFDPSYDKYFDDFVKNIFVLFFFFFFPIDKPKREIKESFFFVLLSIILVSQVAVMLDINPLSFYIKKIYFINNEYGPWERSYTTNQYIDYVSFARHGGFFGNPNMAAKYLNLILTCYLFFTAKKNDNVIKHVCFFILYITSIIITGSRTGFVVTLSIMLFFLKIKKYKIHTRVIPLIILIIPVILAMYHSTELRFFYVLKGFYGSQDYKINLFIDYFMVSLNSLGTVFVGNFYSGTARTYYPEIARYFNSKGIALPFDFDIGYFYYTFGLIGLIALAIKLFSLRRSSDLLLLLPFLLWFLSGSIFFDFKLLIFLMIIISRVAEIPVDSRYWSRPPDRTPYSGQVNRSFESCANSSLKVSGVKSSRKNGPSWRNPSS